MQCHRKEEESLLTMTTYISSSAPSAPESSSLPPPSPTPKSLPLRKKKKRKYITLTFAVANVAEHHIHRLQRSGCILSRGFICTGEIFRDVGLHRAARRIRRGGRGDQRGGWEGERRNANEKIGVGRRNKPHIDRSVC